MMKHYRADESEGSSFSVASQLSVERRDDFPGPAGPPPGGRRSDSGGWSSSRYTDGGRGSLPARRRIEVDADSDEMFSWRDAESAVAIDGEDSLPAPLFSRGAYGNIAPSFSTRSASTRHLRDQHSASTTDSGGEFGYGPGSSDCSSSANDRGEIAAFPRPALSPGREQARRGSARRQCEEQYF